MLAHYDELQSCPLFKNLTISELNAFTVNIDYTLKKYSKNEIIALEEDHCINLGILLTGKIEIKKIFASGKCINLTTLSQGQIFGEVIIFSDKNTYPASIFAAEPSQVVFLSKKEIIHMCDINSKFLSNFMTLLSNKILILNQKITDLSLATVNQKVANYLLNLSSEQKSKKIILPAAKNKIAEKIGIPRPSLSRALIKMKKENIIDFSNRNIEILNIAVLENYLFD